MFTQAKQSKQVGSHNTVDANKSFVGNLVDNLKNVNQSTGPIINYIGIVLDKSSSMLPVTTDVVEAMKKTFAAIKETANSTGQETYISYYTFSDNVRQVAHFEKINTFNEHVFNSYYPYGSTALNDGIYRCVQDFSTINTNGKNVSFLVLVITDGEENCSRVTSVDISKLIKDKNSTDRWSFIFQVPPMHKASLVSLYNLYSDNVIEWNTTKESIRESTDLNVAGINKYYQTRSTGQTKVMDFYTDLSKVTVSDIKRQLTDVSNRYKSWSVPKEVSIKEFVEEKVKKEYVPGSVYHQLMKKETVQPDKAVLLIEKGKKAVWGGKEARDLIGLPSDKTVRITPGNHSNYDVFLQAKSLNRLLVRGTTIFVDMDMYK